MIVIIYVLGEGGSAVPMKVVNAVLSFHIEC